MTTKLKLTILAIIYLVFRISVFRDAVAEYLWRGYLTEGEPLHLLVFIEGTFSMQQTLFTHTFFFVLYLFVTHKPVVTPQFILRCHPGYFRELLLLGAKKVGCYAGFVVAVNSLIPIIYGSLIEINVLYFALVIRFFLTVYVMYLIYMVLLFMIKRSIFSIVGVAIVNLIVVAATLATWNEELQIVIMNVYLFMGLMLLIFMGVKCRKGDFL